MFKRGLFLLTVIFTFTLGGMSFAEEQILQESVKETPKQDVIKGKVEQIAEDGSYLIVGEKKIITTKEFLADALFKVGDDVEINAEETENGLKAVNYNHVLEVKTEKSVSTESKESQPSEIITESSEVVKPAPQTPESGTIEDSQKGE